MTTDLTPVTRCKILLQVENIRQCARRLKARADCDLTVTNELTRAADRIEEILEPRVPSTEPLTP